MVKTLIKNRLGVISLLMLAHCLSACTESYWYQRHLEDRARISRARLDAALSTGDPVTNESIAGSWSWTECKSAEPVIIEDFNRQKGASVWEFHADGTITATNISPDGSKTTLAASYRLADRKIILRDGDGKGNEMIFWCMMRDGKLIFLDFDGCEFIHSRVK